MFTFSVHRNAEFDKHHAAPKQREQEGKSILTNVLIWHGKRTIGPYSADEVLQYLSSGQLQAHSPAWTEGLTDWATLSEVLALLRQRSTTSSKPEFTNLDTRTLVPEGVRGFSWGALFIPYIWCISNHVWIGFLSLIPGLGQLVALWLGFNGRELAWRKGRWSSVQEFQASQRRWNIVGVVFISVLIAMLVGTAAYLRTTRTADVGAASTKQAPTQEAGRNIVSRVNFETRLRGLTTAEVTDLLGRPNYTKRQKDDMLIYIYLRRTVNPKSGEVDDASLIGFINDRAQAFHYAQEEKK